MQDSRAALPETFPIPSSRLHPAPQPNHHFKSRSRAIKHSRQTSRTSFTKDPIKPSMYNTRHSPPDHHHLPATVPIKSPSPSPPLTPHRRPSPARRSNTKPYPARAKLPKNLKSQIRSQANLPIPSGPIHRHRRGTLPPPVQDLIPAHATIRATVCRAYACLTLPSLLKRCSNAVHFFQLPGDKFPLSVYSVLSLALHSREGVLQVVVNREERACLSGVLVGSVDVTLRCGRFYVLLSLF